MQHDASPATSRIELAIDTGPRAGVLQIRASTRADDVFDRFFAAYDTAFVLPDEKEGRDGFLDCLALNEGEAHARLRARFGPFREWVVVVERDGDVVGGANFICYLPADAAASPAMHLNYVFVSPAHRGHGHLRDLLEACRRVACRSLATATPPLAFIELNDPMRMSREAYALDSEIAGVDQFDRIAIWARLGARIIDFPYVQPPLSAAQGADDDLMLAVIGSAGETLDACLLGRHLERFFAISVLKGGDLRASAEASSQLALCDAACTDGQGFVLLDPQPHLRGMRDAAPGPASRGLREQLLGRLHG